MLEYFILPSERKRDENEGKGKVLTAVGSRGATGSPIRRGIGPLLLVMGIMHVMLKVSLSAIPLIVPMDELNIIL